MKEKVKFKPYGDRILIQVQEAETKTKGGLIIPDSAKEKPQKGIIVAVGDGKEEPINLNVGDNVLFGKHYGTEISIEGVDYLILNKDNILGTF